MNYAIFLILPIIIFFLMFIAFGGLSESESTAQGLVDELLCPMPLLQGYPLENARYNRGSPPSNDTKILDCTDVATFEDKDYHHGESFATPAVFGFFFYIGDVISELIHKAVAFFFIIGLLASPPSFPPPYDTVNIFLFMYLPLYIMLIIGILKVLPIPFVS